MSFIPPSQVIDISEDGEKQTLAQQLRGAIYAAAAYNLPTVIVCGDEEAVVVPMHMYEAMYGAQEE